MFKKNIQMGNFSTLQGKCNNPDLAVKILDLSLIQYIHLYYNTATELDDKVKQFVRKHSYPKNYT